MGWKKSFLAAGAGVLGGYLLQKQLEGNGISPEKALKSVKETVGKRHTIDGSWVHMQPETVERYGLDYNTYRGGITVSTDNQVKHYQFLVDAETGTVLEFVPDEA
ncbi:MAG TPA: PepSY domain-containing protein [Bacillales bacterium]|nr:PepSY domain-containing protein [Bacillales bacterium]